MNIVEINILVDAAFAAQVGTDWLQKVAEQVLVVEGKDNVEMGLVVTGQEEIHRLNRDYRHKDEPTDVLSFAMLQETAGTEFPFVTPPDGITHLGEVIISYPQAVIQAAENQHPVEQEITLLVIHGVLHLLGYDHEKPADSRKMKKREREILELIAGA